MTQNFINEQEMSSSKRLVSEVVGGENFSPINGPELLDPRLGQAKATDGAGPQEHKAVDEVKRQ